MVLILGSGTPTGTSFTSALQTGRWYHEAYEVCGTTGKIYELKLNLLNLNIFLIHYLEFFLLINLNEKKIYKLYTYSVFNFDFYF